VSSRQRRNLSASVRHRLLALSREDVQPFDLILVRYGSKRLLYRLSRSRYVDRFLLKGAMLFTIWTEETHRPTRDIDFLGFGANDTDELARIFRDICQTDVEPDGLLFKTETAVRNRFGTRRFMPVFGSQWKRDWKMRASRFR
jgi:hypothetical protein